MGKHTEARASRASDAVRVLRSPRKVLGARTPRGAALAMPAALTVVVLVGSAFVGTSQPTTDNVAAQSQASVERSQEPASRSSERQAPGQASNDVAKGDQSKDAKQAEAKKEAAKAKAGMVSELDEPAKPKPSDDSPSSAPDSAAPEVSDAPCSHGSSVEQGLQSNTIKIHRAICKAFPEVKSYGGIRQDSDSDHNDGRALDIMTSDKQLGDAISRYLQNHSSEFGVSYIIWRQRISMSGSSSWRSMADRGSPTANHMDHVHVSVN
ncbi:hypothetical protein LWF01_04865 [Saxibacter everestensis]|uniref:ARB-07466-like C-terminal domain-containing protein n=1 Tax=Saxibacter everestensis TaxID=2909229 RepID=A0ABY8QXJ0_9MICO|nr:hypothetical protein LWF01_04865 [Brevibacteriaceae bacterium ZFBP1038]